MEFQCFGSGIQVRHDMMIWIRLVNSKNKVFMNEGRVKLVPLKGRIRIRFLVRELRMIWIRNTDKNNEKNKGDLVNFFIIYCKCNTN